MRLLTGADNWRTAGDATAGLRPMAFSDGPAGVRGVAMDERVPSSSLPCPSALGATWDPGLVEEVAAALGAEARGKGIDVLLAPTIHLMRTPLGGRGFECFAEDPVLTARIAVAYVRGVQSAGVACAAKHFICNDSETQRWTCNIQVAPHVLRELYLVPFEAVVREAGVLAVMAGYNSVNGATMTENAALLTSVLKDEWGFGGVVVSDWHAARSTDETAAAGLDLAMPGPSGPWGGRLADAVRAGRIAEAVVDDKVRRVLHLARQVGALEGLNDSKGLDGAGGHANGRGGRERWERWRIRRCYGEPRRRRSPCWPTPGRCSPSTRARSARWPSSARMRWPPSPRAAAARPSTRSACPARPTRCARRWPGARR